MTWRLGLAVRVGFLEVTLTEKRRFSRSERLPEWPHTPRRGPSYKVCHGSKAYIRVSVSSESVCTHMLVLYAPGSSHVRSIPSQGPKLAVYQIVYQIALHAQQQSIGINDNRFITNCPCGE